MSPSRSRYHSRPLALLAVAGALLLPSLLHAQGWIEPRPMPRPLPLPAAVEKLRTHVTVRVDGRIATVEVEEWFRNNGSGLAEGDYTYPMPAGAVFTSYSLYQGEQELRGEMMDAAQARSIYEAIVRAQRDPALIELVGRGMLRARVFPIEAGQTRRITLRYTQVLPRAGDALELQYAAGIQGRRAQPAVPLEFVVHVENGSGFRDAFSPTHAVITERTGGRMSVRPRQALAGDVVVFLPLAERAVGVTAATHRPPGEDGFFMVTLSPGEAAAARVPRDITVVVDVSGSMSGEKMEQARRALHQLLNTLGDEDRVRLISFSSQVKKWRADWAPATAAQLEAARRWVDDLRAEGGTNIHDALAAAFDAGTAQARLPIVVFMTDGMPTVGETDAYRIAAMAEARRGRARVFVLGVGYDVNTVLLDQLSTAARGTTQYVRPSEDVEQAVSLLARRVRHPVLTDLELNVAGVTVRDVYPRELPDLFAGEELVVFGRYSGSGDARITVRGQRGGRAEQFGTSARFPLTNGSGEYLTMMWAARRVGDLDRRIRAAQADGASPHQLEDMIRDLRETALRYGILSEHTSYLVQEPGVFAAGTARGVPAPFAATGQTAVLRAEEARRSREVSSVADMQAVQAQVAARMSAAPTAGSGQRNVRTVAGRAFRALDGAWQDVRHASDAPVVSIEPFSPAWFALLRALPELTGVLRELELVTVAGERVSIRVATGGRSVLSGAEVAKLVTDFRGR